MAGTDCVAALNWRSPTLRIQCVHLDHMLGQLHSHPGGFPATFASCNLLHGLPQCFPIDELATTNLGVILVAVVGLWMSLRIPIKRT
jgi:hypothetical protein